jgi:hypothetical protein
MESQAYFTGIREQIIEQLSAATNTVLVAVAWLTDRELFDALLSCQRQIAQAVVNLRFSATILTAILAWAAPCTAAWVETNNSKEGTLYSEPTTIARNGNRVKVWEMFDLRKPELYEGKMFRSIKIQTEYDCVEKEMRKLYSVLHQEQMGRGLSIAGFALDSTSWTPVPPDSMAQGALWAVCWDISNRK